MIPNDAPKVLTAACRFTDLDHGQCIGHIYLGSIFGKPTDCQCECHTQEETK